VPNAILADPYACKGWIEDKHQHIARAEGRKTRDALLHGGADVREQTTRPAPAD
jgi:hypothetical protein